MLTRLLRFLCPAALVVAAGSLAACANGSKADGSNTFGGGSGESGSSGESSNSGSGTAGSNSSGTLGSGGSLSGALSSSGAAANGDAGRPPRCDANGMNCRCFNVASLGYGGQTGAGAGKGGGTDNTQAFVTYLNSQSSAMVAQLGCGIDLGCSNPNKPDLSDPAFLPQYDVLIFQWLAGSLAPVTSAAGDLQGYQGSNYWNFSAAELTALKAWVMAGGGVIVLSGYDYSAGELAPTNQIVQALTGMVYTATDTYGMVETGNAEFCLGDSNPVTSWAQTMPNGMPDPLGGLITEVGAFHGRTITTGPNSIIDCSNPQYGVCAAHEDVGKGHVYVYTDEWVTYTSQWNPNPQPAGYCSPDGSTANGDFPAVQFAYQTPQFWFNAISYAAQATMCPFTLTGVTPPPR
jgi:hypothetical protein